MAEATLHVIPRSRCALYPRFASMDFYRKVRGVAGGGGRVALNSEVWQGHYAEGFVWALACAAGLNPGKRTLDVDGVDIQISFPGPAKTMKYPLIEAQIKSCCNPTYVSDCFSYSIPVKNYNDLTGQVGVELPTRRYLFLVHTPVSKEDYIQSSQSSSDFHHGIYWLNLMDRDPIDPAVLAHKSVHVPTANLLTVDILRALVLNELDEGGM